MQFVKVWSVLILFLRKGEELMADIKKEKIAHIRIDNHYLRTQEFLKFTRTAEYRVLLFLIASIVRQPGKHAGTKRIYNKHYKDKRLCGSYSMERS